MGYRSPKQVALHRHSQCKYRKRNRHTLAEKARAHFLKVPLRHLLGDARRRAKRQGVAFDLTLVWYLAEYAKGCAISGLRFAPRGTPGKFLVASIDRKNPGGDYIQTNCRLIVNVLNLGLSNHGLEKVLPIWRAVVERNPPSTLH